MYPFFFVLSFVFCSEVLSAKGEPNVLSNDAQTHSSAASSVPSLNASTPLNENRSPQSWPSSLTFVKHDNFGAGHQICIFHGACRLGDGTLLLPSWMSTHSKQIQGCGLRKIVYNMDTSEGNVVFEDSERVDVNLDFQAIDVIGNEAPASERALLVEHITPALLMMDILKRPVAYKNITHKVCIRETNISCQEPTDVSNLHPMMFLDSRVSHTKDFKWPKSLLRMIRNCMEGELQIADLKDLYGWKVRSQAVCFRSVSSTNVKTMSISDVAFSTDHLFFSMNGLSRKPISRTMKEPSTCKSKVLLLNRYGKRFLEGSEALISLISSKENGLKVDEHKLDVETEEVFFEHSSFHEQVSVMQESDIVVATHGEANSNFMFLRPNATVFEIVPFGLASTEYRNISRAYGITYEMVRSQPDPEVFTACIKHFNGDRVQSQNTFVKRWQQVAEEFIKETIRSKENLDSSFSVSDDDQSNMKMLRECVLYQRSSVDVRALARKVRMAAANRCGSAVNTRSFSNRNL